MKTSDLSISNASGCYRVQVRGRANFEYAVPLRELAQSLTGFQRFDVDLAQCTAMDSTFMGVLTMIGLKGRSFGAPVRMLNAACHVQKLLRDLGVAKLFEFTAEAGAANAQEGAAAPKADMLATAETVAEAHETLVQADAANATRFDDVIRYARADVDRLRKDEDQ